MSDFAIRLAKYFCFSIKMAKFKFFFKWKKIWHKFFCPCGTLNKPTVQFIIKMGTKLADIFNVLGAIHLSHPMISQCIIRGLCYNHNIHRHMSVNFHFWVINHKVIAKWPYSRSNVSFYGHLTMKAQNKACFFP